MIFAILAFAVAFAQPPIIHPDPADFSQISGFQAEWCSVNLSSRVVHSICFGKSRFQGTKSIRSVMVRKASGDDLYVEDQWPGVELLKPRFGVIGPVLPSETPVEAGEVNLFLNSEGGEEGLVIETPTLGTIQVSRIKAR